VLQYVVVLHYRLNTQHIISTTKFYLIVDIILYVVFSDSNKIPLCIIWKMLNARV
jgi:hypothetical protein